MEDSKQKSTPRLALKSMASPPTPAPPPTPSPNLKTEDAAKFLNVKTATLEQMRWRGTGPKFVTIGRCVRYRMADLEFYLEGRVFSSTTEAQAGVTA